MTWDNFRQPIEFGGKSRTEPKELEFGKIASLPSLVDAKLEVAVGGTTAPRAEFRRQGWLVRDAEDVSRTLESYRDYVQNSRAKLSVAKNIYVATRSGWFSCRSACYLAAGRPVVVQDTGFSSLFPVGQGLLAFSTQGEAIAAIE